MQKKSIFIDIDGTLLTDKHEISSRTIHAIRQARKNGHLVFLSTGRVKAELFDYIMDVGFDGIIGSAGAYVEFNNQVILQKLIAKDDVVYAVDFFNKHQIEFYLETNTNLFASDNVVDYLKSIMKGADLFIDTMTVGENLYRDDVSKISYLNSQISFENIEKQFKNRFSVIPGTVENMGSNNGELSLPGITKASAIEVLLKHINMDKQNTIAFGDNLNDIEMLEYANLGIAMGNAHQRVKYIADDITYSNNEDGIYHSFNKYKLI